MRKFPNALVIMLSVILLAWVLTYLIPQGEYQRMVDEKTNREIVVAGSYTTIDAPLLSIFQFLVTIPEGIIGRADLIVFILLTGGCFYVIEQTGALKQGIVRLTSVLKGREEVALIIVSIFFAAGGALVGLQEEIIAMTPVLLFFSRSIGYDAFVSVFISYGSAVVGSSFSPFNPFAAMVAQKEAGLVFLSGSGFRLIIFFCAFVCWMFLIIRYANKNTIKKEDGDSVKHPLSIRSTIILVLLALTFMALIYGMLFQNWSFTEMGALFFVLGLLAGVIGNLGINGTSEAYIAGFKEMTFACIIIGLSNTVTLLLKQGAIIDSIVYGLFLPMQYLPQSFSAIAMMVSQALLHFAMSSTSGQAILTMPILIPLSDLLGISRQVCVLAYQYGACMMDMLVPINGAIMAILAISGISFDKWFRFALKPTLFVLGLGAMAIVIAISIGYN